MHDNPVLVGVAVLVMAAIYFGIYFVIIGVPAMQIIKKSRLFALVGPDGYRTAGEFDLSLDLCLLPLADRRSADVSPRP